jgi:hypothetical protein
MSDVWDSFNRQLEVGDGIGRQIRNQRAYNDGGLTAVEQAAGQVGDMAGMEDTREMQRRQTRFQDERTQNAYERMNQIAPRARNIVRATRNMDPQRAGAFLQQNRRFFEDWGFQPEQVDAGIAGLTNADPTVRQQWVEQLDAAFRQHEDPNWQLVGNQVVGVDQQSGDIQLGGRLPDSVGAGGRYATPDEVAQAGYRPGSVVWITPGEPPRVIQAPNAGSSPNAPGQYPDDGYDYHD